MLVNIGEVETDAVLREVSDKLGVRVFAKPRLADVLNIERSGLSNEQYSYALKAHLDFVVCSDDPGARPHFAIEFDGQYHATDAAARRRDAMKDAICERLGLELLRIDAGFLRTVRGFRLVAWLIELWFLEDAFYQAQEAGYIPWDEPFGGAGSIIDRDDAGRLTFPYALDHEARGYIHRAHKERRCRNWIPSCFFRSFEHHGEAFAVLAINDTRWLTSHTRIRAFRFAAGVTPGELAGDLAVVDLANKLQEYEAGTAVAVGREQYDEIMRAVGGRLENGRWTFGMDGWCYSGGGR